MKDEKILRVLIDHFDSTAWPLHVDEMKLRDRYSIVEDMGCPGWDVVEIKRHRSILGAGYTPSLPMSSFETYYMRYAVYREDCRVQELPARVDKVGMNVDTGSLVSEHLSRESFDLSVVAVDAKHYEISDGVSKEKQFITNADEARQFAVSFVDAFGDQFVENVSISRLSLNEDELKQLKSDYNAFLREALVRMADEAWRSRERWDEDA